MDQAHHLYCIEHTVLLLNGRYSISKVVLYGVDVLLIRRELAFCHCWGGGGGGGGGNMIRSFVTHVHNDM